MNRTTLPIHCHFCFSYACWSVGSVMLCGDCAAYLAPFHRLTSLAVKK